MRITHQTLHIIKAVNTFILILALCGCSLSNTVSDSIQLLQGTEYASQTETSDTSENVYETIGQEEAQPELDVIFSSEPIPYDVRDRMWNVTISERSRLNFDDLSYLTLTYMGYDDCQHIGHLVVDKNLSDEVIGIFRELYEIGFPIEKMNLPCDYGGVDELSMEDNNTSAFNDRPIEGSGALSYHQLGRAIDRNPLINPYIKASSQTVLPVTAEAYLDRTLDEKGMITEDSECVRIFKKYGWSWGGDWHSLKDYQHFEKE